MIYRWLSAIATPNFHCFTYPQKQTIPVAIQMLFPGYWITSSIENHPAIEGQGTRSRSYTNSLRLLLHLSSMVWSTHRSPARRKFRSGRMRLVRRSSSYAPSSTKPGHSGSCTLISRAGGVCGVCEDQGVVAFFACCRQRNMNAAHAPGGGSTCMQHSFRRNCCERFMSISRGLKQRCVRAGCCTRRKIKEMATVQAY